ncbi:hypothetical protein KP509_19G042400 [Ceratopteris richardii]|uniref:Uncharacterized protein n=1 Tax=Ceratopteris richardii TaxID=49495 RepID=A0A8T2SKL0_CERRI|nr:hypothetical protein KP509_19G042400 [Ceratopteris richardii]
MKIESGHDLLRLRFFHLSSSRLNSVGFHCES